jgi:predicted nucleic acid-binding protein
MILVDTSAWIDFFRGTAPLAGQVDELLAQNQLAICGPILTELRRGFHSVAERRRVLPLLGGCHFLEQPPLLWEEAGELGFLLGRQGRRVKSMDLLIATYALSHSISLLTRDAAFSHILRLGIPLQLA